MHDDEGGHLNTSLVGRIAQEQRLAKIVKDPSFAAHVASDDTTASDKSPQPSLIARPTRTAADADGRSLFAACAGVGSASSSGEQDGLRRLLEAFGAAVQLRMDVEACLVEHGDHVLRSWR